MSNKDLLRKAAHQARAEQPEKDRVSEQVVDRLEALPEFKDAQRVLWYLDVRDEVRTRSRVFQLLDRGKQSVVVPYCVGEQLELFQLREFTDLVVGRFGILEPAPSLREDPGHRVERCAIDLVVVPGVAFDEQGGRLGHGKGYYDRLFADVPEIPRFALAYQCQIFPRVPMDTHDVRMTKVITQESVFENFK